METLYPMRQGRSTYSDRRVCHWHPNSKIQLQHCHSTLRKRGRHRRARHLRVRQEAHFLAAAAMRGMYQHYNEENCYRRDVIIPILEPSCCANADGYLTWYRAEANCCESDGTVIGTGECLVDAGITYEERVPFYRPVYVHKNDADGTTSDGSSTSDSGSTGSGTGPGNGGNFWNSGGTEGEGIL